MELKSIVVFPETAKKMEKAGWNTKTVFYWHDHPHYLFLKEGEECIYHCFSAPTFQEIISILKAEIDAFRLWYQDDSLTIEGIDGEGQEFDYDVFVENDNLAEAAGQLWLWWKEKQK